MQFLQKALVLGAGELAALIRIEDCRGSVDLHSVPDSLDDGAGVQCVREVPAHDFPAEPVDDGGQIHVAMLHSDVGDVDGPDLIRVNCHISQQIGHNCLLEVAL